MTKTETIQMRSEAIRDLKRRLRPGSTVYTTVTHVARSGMRRTITCHIVRQGGIESITHLVARATGRKVDPRHGGCVVSGCGVDTGFALVYQLGATLWPWGTSRPHGVRNGKPDSDGGYALKQRWL